MKYNTLQRFEHTADVYDFRLTQGGAGNLLEYFFDRTIKCRLFNDGTNRIFVYVLEPLLLNTRLTNLRDKQGNLILGSMTTDTGFSIELASVDPVMNAFGYRDALRYTAVKV